MTRTRLPTQPRPTTRHKEEHDAYKSPEQERRCEECNVSLHESDLMFCAVCSEKDKV